MSTAYGLAALDQECARVASTISGRNSQLHRASFAMGQLIGAGALERGLAEARLFDAAVGCGYVAKDGVEAARSTIRSGLDRGERNPRMIRSGGTKPTFTSRLEIIGPSQAKPICHDLARDDADRVSKARWLWSLRQALDDRYLRHARGLTGPFPTTLGFLPAQDPHPPSMIAAFGNATEAEPGLLAIAERDVMAVHLTKLKPDGSGKADVQSNKIMIGRPKGSPIVLAPPNGLLGLCITEGIEDALSAHEAMGFGAWAAGSASLIPALADAVPQYIDCVSILAHRDPAGIKGANELATNLRTRGIECAVTFLGMETAA